MATNSPAIQALDAMTGGAFSATTSGERAARVRAWLETQPPLPAVQQVFAELSGRDKGAAKPLRERLEESRRAKAQEAVAQDWATKAQALLAVARLNVADAMAWQRDAAKAGAPLSREPLLSLKAQLAERIKTIEDLQHQAQVQREAAVLLAHRMEVLGTRSWRDAHATSEPLRADVAHWREQWQALATHPQWASVDVKYTPLLEASGAQLLVVWDAFEAALRLAVAAAADSTAPLPPVPLWAQDIRAERGEALQVPASEPAASIDPAQRAQANQRVREALQVLEAEMAQGHGKASAGAASQLRQALKDSARLLDDGLESAAHAALGAAGELQSWQRWRSDQLRHDLVRKAAALVAEPLDGRRQQEALRGLRDQWKLADQGGVANHALWRRFDEACTEAHRVVEAWLAQVKAESEAHRLQRLALIEEVSAWRQAQGASTDWKTMSRELHRFSERWREAGHLPEKAFTALQAQWKAVMHEAHAPLEAAQKSSLERRQGLIAEAQTLGAEPVLRVDTIRALQQRWQLEAQAVPLERKQEQKLWDAFRKPLDDAFARKTQEREKAAQALSALDRAVLEAARALEQANASGDGARIRAAMGALEDAAQGRTPAPAPESVAASALLARPAGEAAVVSEHAAAESQATVPAPATDPETASSLEQPSDSQPLANAPIASGAASPAGAGKPARPVVAVRGDDRPGMKKATPAPAGRGEGRREGRPGRPAEAERRFAPGVGADSAARGPRLGDAAFRAQREALEHADAALRRLSAQAHGEVLTQLLTAWERRDAAALPAAQQLGKRVVPAARAAWAQALAAAPSGAAAPQLLRLEIAADIPTPAEHLSARRLLQLQLLTRKSEAAPAETWARDVTGLLATPFEAAAARRLQAVLKVFLKGQP